jgi:DNA-binding protein HU-beta
MIKADIVKSVAGKLGKKDKEALVIVDTVIDSLKEVICEYQRLEVRDFGVFQVKQRKPRIGRNPKDKKEYPIPPRKVVTFKLGKELKVHAVTSAEEGQREPEVAEPAAEYAEPLSAE